MPEVMFRISAPHYVAGVFIRDGKVIAAAPIVKYMMGWTQEAVQRYCAKKGWSIDSKALSR